MEVSEMLQLKEDMRRRINACVEEEINSFFEKTDMMPEKITVILYPNPRFIGQKVVPDVRIKYSF